MICMGMIHEQWHPTEGKNQASTIWRPEGFEQVRMVVAAVDNENIAIFDSEYDMRSRWRYGRASKYRVEAQLIRKVE
jgi:hypothetical protein